MKNVVPLCLLFPLLAGCTDGEEGASMGLMVSVREYADEERRPPGWVDWTVDVDELGFDSLPLDLQELLETATERGNASHLYRGHASQPIFDWVNLQWQAQSNEGEAPAWPTLHYQERRYLLSYTLI